MTKPMAFLLTLEGAYVHHISLVSNIPHNMTLDFMQVILIRRVGHTAAYMVWQFQIRNLNMTRYLDIPKLELDHDLFSSSFEWLEA